MSTIERWDYDTMEDSPRAYDAISDVQDFMDNAGLKPDETVLDLDLYREGDSYRVQVEAKASDPRYAGEQFSQTYDLGSGELAATVQEVWGEDIRTELSDFRFT
jgi:hypothetical protein